MSRFKDRPNTEYIVVHCSATPPEMNIGAATIRRWHLDRGWLDIGYHFVIRRNGTIEPGRPMDAVGAHVRGHNYRSIGVCLVGGVTKDEQEPANNFTEDQMHALVDIIRVLRWAYPKAKIIGHRDLDSSKACPSFDAKATFEGQTFPPFFINPVA